MLGSFIESINDGSGERKPRTPRIGTTGCCGKGCNGCLIFWHDAAYAKAREIMRSKKIGEKLIA